MQVEQVRREDSNIELLDVPKLKELTDKISKIISGEEVADSRKPEDSISNKTHVAYMKCASRFLSIDEYGIVSVETSVEEIIKQVRASERVATLRFRATAIRYAACNGLKDYEWLFSSYLQTYGFSLTEYCRLVDSKTLYALLQLGNLYPSDYRGDDWVAKFPKHSKIWSLKGLRKDWRELMASVAWWTDIKYQIPILVALVTGVRPCELEKGVLLTKENGKLVALIRGGKVTEDNGQPTRKIVLADHLATRYLTEHMMKSNKDRLLVKVNSGNSVTKSMTRLGKSLWPKHKENITLYTARHAIASDCKKVDRESGEENPLFTSAVLGHRSDLTKRTYGNCRYGSGSSGGVAPVAVEVKCEIRVHTKSKDFIKGKNQSRSKKPSM